MARLKTLILSRRKINQLEQSKVPIRMKVSIPTFIAMMRNSLPTISSESSLVSALPVLNTADQSQVVRVVYI